MCFPANPIPGDTHTFPSNDRIVTFTWDGITWNRIDEPEPKPPRATRPNLKLPEHPTAPKTLLDRVEEANRRPVPDTPRPRPKEEPDPPEQGRQSAAT